MAPKIIGSARNLQEKNTMLKEKYDKDPRSFWTNPATTRLDEYLVRTAYFVHSIRWASANAEREFSRMGWMISSGQSAITAEHAYQRLTMANQLPQKRRLEELMDEREIKKQELFDYKK